MLASERQTERGTDGPEPFPHEAIGFEIEDSNTKEPEDNGHKMTYNSLIEIADYWQ